MYGIELEKLCGNGSNGTINDKHYFECKPGHGYFVKLDELFENFEFGEDDEIPDDILRYQYI